MRRAIWCLVLLFSLSITPAYSYWIWTPKTKKFVNPKTLPKETPKEQLEYALTFVDSKKYNEAVREFQKLLKAYPKSAEAAESQYYLGVIEEARRNPFEAFQAYQKVIDKYPFSERIQEINEKEYKIGEDFMSGKYKTILVDNPAIQIFTKVIENSTYGPLASKAQYKLGLVLKGLMRYYEAEEAFNKVISNYPASEWVEAAKFQIAACRQAVSHGPEYDQAAAQEAKQKFEEFVKEHPDAVLSRDAEKNIDSLKEKEAESGYNIGLFYEKQKAYDSAKIYYNDLVNIYPNSLWSAKAAERLEILERKK